jgi:hypothetical protein
MKKIHLILFLVVFAFYACKNEKTVDYRIIGAYTPFNDAHMKVNGKVEKATLKYFWAVPEGDTYVKGKQMTMHELDSLNSNYDFEVVFNESGFMKSCTFLDDNGNVFGINRFTFENGFPSKIEVIRKDTLRSYEIPKCNSFGQIIAGTIYRAGIDTVQSSYTVYYSPTKDTVIWQNHNYKGEKTNKVVRLTDKYGQFLSASNFNRNGNYTGGDSVPLDEKDRELGIIYYDSNKNISWKVDFINREFDSKDNITKAVFKTGNGFIGIFEMTYTYYD